MRIVLALLVVLVALLPLPASAQSSQARFELPVAGTLVIDPDGTVVDLEIDPVDRRVIPPGVAAALERRVRTWRFHPVMRDGVAVRAEASLALRLEAVDAEDERSMRVGLQALRFYESHRVASSAALAPSGTPRVAQRVAPVVPEALRGSGFEATVTALMQVGEDGRPAQVAVQSVRLYGPPDTSDDQALEAVAAFSAAARATLGQWRFTPPSRGAVLLRVPLDFRAPDTGWRVLRMQQSPRLPSAFEGRMPADINAGGAYAVRHLRLQDEAAALQGL